MVGPAGCVVIGLEDDITVTVVEGAAVGAAVKPASVHDLSVMMCN